jgi:hypothetical protein
LRSRCARRWRAPGAGLRWSRLIATSPAASPPNSGAGASSSRIPPASR